MIPQPRFASLITALPLHRRLHTLGPSLRPASRISLYNSARFPASITRGIRSYPRTTSNSKSSFRSSIADYINKLSPTVLVGIIIGINGGVFLLWQGAKGEASSGNWTELKWMSETFLSSSENLKNGRYWVLLSSCFSHEGFGHLLFNCFTFYFVGRSAIQILGNTRFLSLYLGAGVFGNIVSYVWHEMKGHRNYASHGASGAVYGVLSFFACVAPTAMFYLYGIVPIPAFVIVPGILAWDTWSSLRDRKSTTDHSGHVGGIVGGLLYYLLRFRMRL